MSAAGVVTRAPAEILRALELLRSRGAPFAADLGARELAFHSRLLHVDPGYAYVLIEASPSEAANAALLERPRCTFIAALGGLHLEFAAARPARAAHLGRPAIRLAFPDVMVTIQRREHERMRPGQELGLACVADEAGVISFRGRVVDISEGGLGMLLYAPDITLEPGTVLHGCRIERPEGPLFADLEVRYSMPVVLPDGARAKRSGCRFVDPPAEIRRLVEALRAKR